MRLLPALTLATLLPLLSGCCLLREAPDKEDSGHSDLPTVQPADFEYQRSFPGTP